MFLINNVRLVCWTLLVWIELQVELAIGRQHELRRAAAIHVQIERSGTRFRIAGIANPSVVGPYTWRERCRWRQRKAARQTDACVDTGAVIRALSHARRERDTALSPV